MKRCGMTILLVLTMLLAACSAAGTPAPAVETAAVVTTSAPAAGESSNSPESVAPPPGYEGKTWNDIEAEARGQTVNFYMWGGNEATNTWVTGYAAQALKQQYGITLNMTPVTDIVDTVNKVLGEKQAGKDTGGSVDLIWINGENFRAMREAGLLYGPWSEFLPNSAYVNWDDDSVAYDFGYPVDGYEAPYGKAQFVMVYDSAKVEKPPATIPELLAWAKANPGKFTYAAPPDFTGSVFVRHVCYSATGGYQQFLRDFDQEFFNNTIAPCWQALKDVAPSLWREGQTYPENRTRMQDLFANGEVYFDMTYNPSEASSLISQGKYPETARTFVFSDGTIANTHYLAVVYNSSHKAGAMVAANFMLSPAAQFSKSDPTGWGDLTALDVSKLPAEWQQKFAEQPRGPATLPDADLAVHRLPELQADWLTAIEKGWEENVLPGQ